MSKDNKVISFFTKNEALSNVFVFSICLIIGIIFGSTIDIIKNASAESYIDNTPASIASETIKTYEQKPAVEKVESAAIQQRNEYTEPKVITGTGILSIPSINLNRYVSLVSKGIDPQNVIDSGAIAAYNGNILLAHNPGSFSGLYTLYSQFLNGSNLSLNYNGREYTVYDAEIISHDGKQYNTKYGKRSLNRLSETNSLVLVTCFGNNQRIMIYAR